MPPLLPKITLKWPPRAWIEFAKRHRQPPPLIQNCSGTLFLQDLCSSAARFAQSDGNSLLAVLNLCAAAGFQIALLNSFMTL